MLAAGFRLSPEIIFLLIAAVLAGVSKIVEVSRQVRRSSLERRRREAERTAVVFEEAPRPKRASPPSPPRRLVLPLRPAAPMEVARLQPVPEALPAEPPPPPQDRRPVRNIPLAGRRRCTPHPPAVPFVKRLRSRPRALREAILLREILGPPYALRRAPRRRW